MVLGVNQVNKVNDNIRWYNFCLRSGSDYFTIEEPNKNFLNGTVYDFSVEHSSI